MKHSTGSDLSALSSGILGLMGICLVLIPLHLKPVFTDIPIWALTLLGIFSFATSLSIQVLFIINFHPRRNNFFRGVSIVFLFIFTAALFQVKYFIEGFIFFILGSCN
jgi:hypothetical protein